MTNLIETAYSLRWIPVGRRAIPFIQTWELARTDDRGRRYFRWRGPCFETGDRTAREVSEKRISGGLLTLEQLREKILGGQERWGGNRRVAYHFQSGSLDHVAPAVKIETLIIRAHDCSRCCPEDCVPTADLVLRHGRLLARRKPSHADGEFAYQHYGDFDRLVPSIDAAFEQSRRIAATLAQSPMQSGSSRVLHPLEMFGYMGHLQSLAATKDDPPKPSASIPVFINDDMFADSDQLRVCNTIFVSELKSPQLNCLAEATQAKEVTFWRGELKGSHVDSLRSMPQLEKLRLHETRLSEGAQQRLRWLPPTTEVSISMWMARDEEVQHMARIRGLNAAKFKAYKVTSLSLRKLTRCVSLESLDFTYGRVSSFGAALLPKLPKLKRLSVQGCRVSHGALQVIGQCAQLEWLDVSCLRMSDRYCRMVAALPCLKTLFVDGTKVSGRGLALLAESPTLERLSIRRTPRISSAAIESFVKMRPDVELFAGAGWLVFGSLLP